MNLRRWTTTAGINRNIRTPPPSLPGLARPRRQATWLTNSRGQRLLLRTVGPAVVGPTCRISAYIPLLCGQGLGMPEGLGISPLHRWSLTKAVDSISGAAHSWWRQLVGQSQGD